MNVGANPAQSVVASCLSSPRLVNRKTNKPVPFKALPANPVTVDLQTVQGHWVVSFFKVDRSKTCSSYPQTGCALCLCAAGFLGVLVMPTPFAHAAGAVTPRRARPQQDRSQRPNDATSRPETQPTQPRRGPPGVGGDVIYSVDIGERKVEDRRPSGDAILKFRPPPRGGVVVRRVVSCDLLLVVPGFVLSDSLVAPQISVGWSVAVLLHPCVGNGQHCGQRSKCPECVACALPVPAHPVGVPTMVGVETAGRRAGPTWSNPFRSASRVRRLTIAWDAADRDPVCADCNVSGVRVRF